MAVLVSRDRKVRAGPHGHDGLYGFAVLLCMTAGVLFRIYGAWASRYISDPDSGIVALMAKHMAEGGTWPVFFYGQSYMGSLEPALSALLCRLMGVNGFAVCLGSALLACLTLPVVFAWARETGGRAAGLAALALCMVGPYHFFMFQFAPRGGYMLTLLLALLVMWLSCRAAMRCWWGRPPSALQFFVIGLLGGVGWWTNQLIAAALVCAALVLVVGLRGRIFVKAVWIGLLGFAVGSSPFWVWNARHGWESFAMLSNVGGMSLAEGAGYLAQRYDRLLGLASWPAWARAPVAAAYPALCLAGLVAGLARARRWPETRWHLGMLIAFVLFSLALFVRSTYAAANTARYLVPLVPPAAILAGLFVAWLTARFGRAVGALPVVLLLAAQWTVFPDLLARSASTDDRSARDDALATFLKSNGIRAAYCHFRYHPLNFNLGEAFSFTDLRGDRHVPLARAAELSDRVSVLDNFGRVSDFLEVGGGGATVQSVARYRIEYNFVPPGEGIEELAAAGMEMLDYRGESCTGVLTDRNVDTWWSGGRDAEAPGWIEVRFAAPATVRGIRLLGRGPYSYPRIARLEARRSEGAEWEVVYDDHPVTDFFWSGPRPYWGGRRFRMEYRLADLPVVALRIVCASSYRGAIGGWRVSELQVFGPGGDPAPEDTALPGLVSRLGSGRIQRLYCDRWAANRVHEAFGEQIAVELEPASFPKATFGGDGAVDVREGSAVLVRLCDAAVTRAALTEAGVVFDEEPAAPWVLFVLAGLEEAALLADGPCPVYWTGFACMMGRARERAWALLESASALAETAPEEALTRLRAAVTTYPNIVTSAGGLLAALREHMNDAERSRLEELYRETAEPDTAIPVEFAGGIKLEGVTVQPAEVAAGGAFTIRYFWRTTESFDPARRIVFVHFLRDGVAFQDDHALLEAFAESQPVAVAVGKLPAEVLREERRVRVPEDAAPGLHALRLGIYDPLTRRRLRLKTQLDAARRAVRMPGIVNVRDGVE